MPKLLVVVDLDYTLWPYYAHNVTNERVHKCVLFDGVTEVLQHLKVLQDKNEIVVSIASASPKKEVCVKILKQHNQAWVLKHNRIFHDNKQRHIRELCKETKIPMERTVLFDDSKYFRNQVQQIGVLAIPIDPKIGITLKDVRSGIERLKSRQKERSMMSSYFKRGGGGGESSSCTKKRSKEINNSKKKKKKRRLDDDIACPICNLKFPKDTIEEHASSCGL